MTTDCKDDPRSRTDDRRTSWLSLGFEELVRSIGLSSASHPALGSTDKPFDVLIVGTGYGGSIAAAQFAGATDKHTGKPISVCVLERGREYLPGMFPGAADELLGHVRFNTSRTPHPAGRTEGLFDLRLGPDVNAVVANGLGGGSLINAGVMWRPTDEVLASHPMLKGLDPYFTTAKALLKPVAYPVGMEPTKAQALRRLRPDIHWPVDITVCPPKRVTPAPLESNANVKLEHCLECGDCATGCNFGAKDSLDLGLLVRAAHNGAEIYTGASVMRIERAWGGQGWIAHTVPTDRALRIRHGPPLEIRARKLVLAAGTFGSTEILLRSHTDKLKFSEMLGRRFSTNGDMLAVIHGHDCLANAIADEGDDPRTYRHVGPSITSMIDLRDCPETPYAIQELAVPGPLRRVFEELFATALTLDRLGESDEETHTPDDPRNDPCSVDRQALKRTSIVAIMGDDGAEGALELIGDDKESCGDGAILVRWPKLRGGSGDNPNDSLFDRQLSALEALVEKSGSGGVVLPNPVWRLLPKKLSFLIDEGRGPPLTVHPLGGCVMGERRESGVVNMHGQVFDASSLDNSQVFADLVVIDGSVVPRALGINPALTISALALRATELLLADWRLDAQRPPYPPLEPRTRPIFQDKAYAPKPESTVSIVERMSGLVKVTTPGYPLPRDKIVELTIRYVPSALTPFLGGFDRVVQVDPHASFYRIFDQADYERCHRPDPHGKSIEDRLEAKCAKKPLSGTLRFFHRERSTPCQRRRRALAGWWFNRGWRDTCDFLRQRWREIGQHGGSADSMIERARAAWALASRAGEARLFEYELTGEHGADKLPIRGFKRLTYGYRKNFWRQLETMELTEFLGAPAEGIVNVDLTYFSEEKTPLLRIEKHDNLVTTLMDVASFGGLLARILINIHVWTFRRPDDQRPRQPNRLPGEIERSWILELLKLRIPPPRPRVYEIVVDRLADATPVMIRLTRYTRFDDAAAARNPVLLIHGYSASGTTFAHTAVRPNLAEELWNRERDVWIVDLRTSAGMPTATLPWAFEDAALVDIPAAIEFILRETGKKKVDVVAHCMGAAMLSMVILKPPEEGDALFDVRAALPRLLGRVVLSQVGPVVQFTSINVLRADVMKYIRRYIAGSTYEFRVKAAPSVAEQLVDRFLSSLRYPRKELALENPWGWGCKRTEFVGTRHRIDALYGRAFSLANMSDEVLDEIDDFFGPLSLETVSQGMHLAKETVITDRAGRNVFLSRRRCADRWRFPTLTIHGGDNGMVDVMTQVRIDNYFNHDINGRRLPHRRVEQQVYPNVGHQDCLIGKRGVTEPIFDRIIDFLDREDPAPAPPPPPASWLIKPPWIGPNRGPGPKKPSGTAAPNAPPPLCIAAATNRKLGDAVLAVCVAVRRGAKHYEPVPIPGTLGGMSSVYLFNAVCDKDGWLGVDITPNLLASAAEGFLFLLVYDQPMSLGAEGLQRLARFREDLQQITRDYAIPLNLAQLLQQLEVESPTFERIVISPGLFKRLQDLADTMTELGIGPGVEKQVIDDLGKDDTASYQSAFIATPPPKQANAPKPAPAAEIFVASCQYPSGLLDQLPAWSSYARLARVIAANAAGIPTEQKLLLLVGDQVYSDATAGFADPDNLDERYRRPHEALFSRDEVKATLREIPTVMMLDDHEISDNWEPSRDDPRPRDALKPGVDAYKDFQRRAGPDFLAPCAEAPEPLWFMHAVGDVNLFVADTRTERHVRKATESEKARIMSECQQQALLKWLRDMQEEHGDAPKFVASPAILLPRKLEWEMRSLDVPPGTPGRASVATSLRSDSWAGYPASMETLLAWIVEKKVANVVFVSGDEHLFCYATATVSREDGSDPQEIRSIHSSALYAPLPFANAARADFHRDDEFCFAPPPITGASAGRYRCQVHAEFPDIHHGFARVFVSRATGAWKGEVTFHDADPDVPAPSYGW